MLHEASLDLVLECFHLRSQVVERVWIGIFILQRAMLREDSSLRIWIWHDCNRHVKKGLMIWMQGDVNDNIIISCDCKCLLKTAKLHSMSMSSLTFFVAPYHAVTHQPLERLFYRYFFVRFSVLQHSRKYSHWSNLSVAFSIHHAHPLEARTHRSPRTFSSLSSSLRQTPRLIQATSNTLLRLTDISLDVAIVASMRRYEYSQCARALMPIWAYWVRCPWPPSLSIDKKLFSCYGNR